MSGWLAVLLLQGGTEPSLAHTPLPATLPRVTPSCSDRVDADAIVVCGARRDRYRLPLPVADPDDQRGAGEAPSAVAAITPHGDCGLFAGQRSCSKREAARYGYGEGRDPVTLLGRLGRKLLDPDADLAAPPKLP